MTRETHQQILRESIRNHINQMGYGNVQDAIDRLLEGKTLNNHMTDYRVSGVPAEMLDHHREQLLKILREHDKDLIVRMVLEAFRT